MVVFSKLPREAQRAAFAHMDARAKAADTAKKAGRRKYSLGSGDRHKAASAAPGLSEYRKPKLGPALTEGERARLEAFVGKMQARAAASPDDRYTAGAKRDAKTRAEIQARRRRR